MAGDLRFVLSRHAAVLTAALLFFLPSRGKGGEFTVQWRADERNSNSAYVAVAGIPAAALQQLKTWAPDSREWPRLLSVYVHEDAAIIDLFKPGMAGEHVVGAGTLQFRPRFPLVNGVDYRAEFQPAVLPGGKKNQPVIVARFRVPKAAGIAQAFVTGIYPTADILPENLLKFYIYFSAPMSRGGIYDYIKLRDESGREVELPFLQIDEELWDAEMKRLTLFIDPGRIKRGVLPLEEVGPALEAGKTYELVVHEAWRDAVGNPLKETFRKRFAVGEPDRDAIDPERWKLTPPKAGTKEFLAVNFGEPLDHALAARLVEVVRERGVSVAGKKSITQNERAWQFVPDGAWAAGGYHLAVQSTIEDLAGNNIGKPFEVDLFEGVQRRITNSVVKIPFEIR